MGSVFFAEKTNNKKNGKNTNITTPMNERMRNGSISFVLS